MTRGPNTPLVPPFEDPESALKRNKGKDVESSNTPKKSPLSNLKIVFGKKKSSKSGASNASLVIEEPVKEDIEYETEEEEEPTYEHKSDFEDELAITMPAIPATATFELKVHILALLREIPFTGKDHEDTYKHLDEVNDVADYFNVPNVPRETQLLRMLPVTLKGAVKDWLKSLPPETITTWAQLKEEFIDQFCPPSKISKLKKAIANFEQQAGESLYEAWERYKSLLRNCPHHDLNSQQEVSIFYDGVNVTTRQLLELQGPLTKKPPPMIKQLIEEFSKHSREYHNPRNDVTRGSAYAASEDLSAVMAMLKNMDRRMDKIDHTIHAIRVGCENYNGPHLTRDCDLDENGNKKVQAKEEKFRQKGRGFYQKEEPVQERKPSLEEMLTKFVAASEKRHSDHDAAIQETRTMLRNQQASIHNIETQLGQLAQQINQRSPGKLPSKTENNPRGAHINIVTTRSGKIITPLAPI
ncbi:uncharacterized protein LOC128133603 [Lactuca sativa]|uniref:uncharacterized protein LOC128133603 n=1 Tax=Lactuca sativa TaxID=4236 RepID=UPI0022AEC54C|nr:uncharacterized protein LOC128133603 [Lactuca sativa]